MSGIRSRNTKPEMVIRKGLHRLGFRYSLHDRSLRGTPDIVLSKYGAVIFVHGCFWHGHDCALFRLPATRTDFWREKIARNRSNDARAKLELLRQKWRVLTVWECALRGKMPSEVDKVLNRTALWLKSSRRHADIRATAAKAA